ncbi:hypothetical protein QU481_14410 [Crenobacter sp. SG2303]|uniref:Uncharacterized protein n=1 Tax=Crenobacter oryzisoli TaxID=3056844 RepID=A0ABT7XQL1_9NEIS|nr:hypothetical protein [Crenobacter sp. SG2303]MDN0076079.1 hypothetical protein [Crenobacter sp. SG2303]
MKNKIIVAYVGFGILYALYAWIFGDTAHKSFAYNLGQGLVWPAVMFPSLGKIMGAIIIVAFVAVITVL